MEDCCWWWGCQWSWARGPFVGWVGNVAAREGLEEVGPIPVRLIAIGGGVAPTPSSRVEEMVDEIAEGSGDGVGAGAGDSEGGSGVR